MKYQLLFIILISAFSNKMNAQENKIINPKNNWYLGAEVGLNKIQSFTLNEPNKSFQIGIISEYYFAKNWSFSTRLKYYKTGLSFYKEAYHPHWLSGSGHDEIAGTFNGSVISIPLNLKLEFSIYKNLRANLKTGFTFNSETKSEYNNYTDNVNTLYPSFYASFNAGLGFNYFLNERFAIFIDAENYFGPQRGKIPNKLFSSGKLYLVNTLINCGVKYNFKRKIENK